MVMIMVRNNTISALLIADILWEYSHNLLQHMSLANHYNGTELQVYTKYVSQPIPHCPGYYDLI